MLGWVVGHSFIVYGPLLQGATSILYEGKPVGTPDVRLPRPSFRCSCFFLIVLSCIIK